MGQEINGWSEAPLADVRRFTCRDLLNMERAGILGADEHVELLHGVIFKMAINPPHAWAVNWLNQCFSAALAGRALVICQNPLRLSDDWDDNQLPQPDLMLVRDRAYADHPLPDDVQLVVEVSDSSLAKDVAVKLPLYAQAGIAEAWIVNLIDRRLEVYTEPGSTTDDSGVARAVTYQRRVDRSLTECFALTAFPDVEEQWVPDRMLDALN